MSVNKVILIGRIGQDPELKETTSNKVCQLSLATTEKFKKDGQWDDRTEWHRVVAWGKTAELCAKYLSKGRQVYVEGRLQTRSWESDGQTRYSTEIVASVVQFLGSSNKETNEEIPF